MSLLIKNCRILTDKIIEKNILIENSKIAKITSEKPAADETLDAKNNIILPGLIDPHVHFREPGMTQKEDFLTGSRAAAAGGITTVLDMPNTKPPTITAQALEEKRELARRSVVNYGFHFGGTDIAEIRKAKDFASVKLFMNISTGKLMVNDEIVKKVMENSKITSVHAENENVKKAISFNKNKLYLCHITTEKELSYIKNNVFIEVTPHHLFLTKEDENNFIKMKPCLKTKKDQLALWNAINSISTIGSDHAPHTIEEKGSGEFFGVPGVETTLPLMLDAVNKNRLTLKRLVELMTGAYKVFSIKNKGRIAINYDADLTIIDLKKEKRVKNDALFTKCRWSPFNQKILKGWPITTIINGNIVFNNDEVYNIKANGVEYNGRGI